MNAATKPLPDVFRAMIAEIISKQSPTTSDWKLVGGKDATQLTIPKVDPDGFTVTVLADQQEVTVSTEFLAHQHFTSDGDHSAVCSLAMGLVRDLLAPNMRVRVLEVGGSPYRATLEAFQDGEWKNDGTTGLLVISWLRKKTERIYSNQRLPARDFVKNNP